MFRFPFNHEVNIKACRAQNNHSEVFIYTIKSSTEISEFSASDMSLEQLIGIKPNPNLNPNLLNTDTSSE